MSPFRKVKYSVLNCFTPRPPKGGVPNNEQFTKVPFSGFRGEFTFRSRLSHMRLKILFISALISIALISCSKKNTVIIQGTLEEGSGNMIYLERLDINRAIVLDSVKISKNDNFRFRSTLNNPDIYMLRNNRGRFLTFMPQAGERISIYGNYQNPGKEYRIEGSAESEKIKLLADKLSNTKAAIKELEISRGKDSTLTESQNSKYLARRSEIVTDQRNFSIRFIIENLNSISGIYALYQTIDEGQLVLGENTDIQYMKILADSLSVKYPEVPLVVSFVNDARESERRYYNQLVLIDKLKEASTEMPDIVLPDMNGNNIKLSSLKGKTVLLYFWSSISIPSRNQNPSLHGIYEKYKHKGFEVYAVSLDNDREMWERAVRIDELQWINVSDLKFPESEAALLYNVRNIPVNFLINKQGDIIARDLYGSELEKWLSNILN